MKLTSGRRRLMAPSLSGLDLVPGFRARVIDANLQVRKTALQRDGAAFGAFSGIEFGLDSPIDLKRELCRWKLVGRRSHVRIPWHIWKAIGYCESNTAGKVAHVAIAPRGRPAPPPPPQPVIVAASGC